MRDISECLRAVSALMDEHRVDRHAIEQLAFGLGEQARGLKVIFEQRLGPTRVEAAAEGGIDVFRKIDVLTLGVDQLTGELRLTANEVKVGYAYLSQALKSGQLIQDAAIAIQFNRVLQQLAPDIAATFRNVWRFIDIEFGGAVPASLKASMGTILQRLVAEGFSFSELQTAIGSFNFVDKAGAVIRTELSKSGELIFRDAMGVLLGTDGTFASVALSAAKGSPDFRPAMEILLGPRGTLADSAREAATRADLDPAFANLEEEIEQGVTQAMDEAGDAAAGRGAVALGTKLGEGARALGDVFTAVPQLYDSVSQLGEAWDKPLTSTKDYMDLFSKMGGVIGQGVDTIQKLAGVTKIASAAQAVFNAIMALNPIVLVVLAVLALIAVIVALIAYWDEVKAALRDNPWLAVVAALFGVIGVIVVVIAYWDEIKLAVLEAANFISIQAQRIGLFFKGVGTLIAQVWNWIVDSLYNAGVGIVNTFSEFGASIVNLFIGIANDVIDLYNDVAAYIPGLDEIEHIAKIEPVRIAEREVQKISVEAAFAPAMGPITGGLEEQIAAQRATVAAAEEEDRARRAREAERPALGAPPAPAGVLAGRPGLPEGAAAAGAVDQSVRVEGGITVNISAERLEPDIAPLLADEFVRRLKERLDALRSEQEFRTGVRSPATV
jgi:hypothetical protein